MAASPTNGDYKEYLRWSYDDVSRWLESLDSDFNQYVDSFKRTGVDGHCLLQHVNDRLLQQIGVNDQKHREAIWKGIEQLKSEVSTDFYKQFHGDDYADLWKLTKISEQDPRLFQQKLHDQMKLWNVRFPRTISVEYMGFVLYSTQYRIFLQQILNIAHQYGPEEGFLMTLSARLFLKDQQKIVERLRKYKRETAHKRFNKVCIVRGWYGCSHEERSEITHNGFKRMVRLGSGDNDKGFCFKSSLKAAAEEIGAHGCVIMCYIILRHPFPTLIQPDQSTEDCNRYRFYSDGRHTIHQAEAPISNNYRGNRYDRTATDVNDGLYDEFVTFQQKDILPQVLVYLSTQRSWTGMVWQGVMNWA